MTTDPRTLDQRDLAHLIHPVTAPRELDRDGPRIVVSGDGWKPLVTARHRLAQGYLATGDRSAVRVRIQDDAKAFLTIKSAVSGTTRQEFEYEIPVADARDLLKLAVGGGTQLGTVDPDEAKRFAGGCARRLGGAGEPGGAVEEVTPAPFNLRTRVNEYGGRAFAAGGGLVVSL